jgi:hypothetical protein
MEKAAFHRSLRAELLECIDTTVLSPAAALRWIERMQLQLPDPVTGVALLLPSQTRIVPFGAESAFLSTPEGATASDFVRNAPHTSYKLCNKFDASGVTLGIIVYFLSGQLTSMKLFVSSSAQNWNEWTEADALQQRNLLEQILMTKYGSTRNFSWGTTAATYDPRSGSSAIVIRYR